MRIAAGPVLRRARWALPMVAAGLFASAPSPAPATPALAMLDAAVARPPVRAAVECSHPFPRAIPHELRSFVDPGARAVCAHPGDVNNDRDSDFVLVIERQGASESWTRENFKRSLLVVTREPGGALRLAARSDHAVMCSTCGGVWGDPFDGIDIEPGTFTVYHYAGSASRWRADFTFGYVPDAGTWRLAKVEELSYWTGDPEKVEETTYTPPADFGTIDLADFHPETWNPRRPRE